MTTLPNKLRTANSKNNPHQIFRKSSTHDISDFFKTAHLSRIINDDYAKRKMREKVVPGSVFCLTIHIINFLLANVHKKLYTEEIKQLEKKTENIKIKSPLTHFCRLISINSF
jgi:hypothetical protein